MALYTIADLHLACGVAKPMDVFGGRWEGYMDKIAQHWRECVGEDDTVVIGGDFSWGLNLAQAKADFAFLERLPGRKLLLKGNHDLWWETVTKMNRFLEENGFTRVAFLHNNAHACGDIALCGTRGWPYDEDPAGHDAKIFRRELLRLEASLKLGQAMGLRETVCFLHYPPLYMNFRCGEILELLHRYGVRRCIYGHLHSESRRWAVEGEREGIEFRLVSGDHVDFRPVLLAP